MESLKQKIKQKKRGFTWSGFSLVELLIAAGISLVILMVIGLVYISSERSFRFGQAALDTEANLRLAMDWLTRDIREAENIAISGDTVTINMPSAVASDDVVYIRVDNKLTREQESNTKTIVTHLTEFEISTGDTVAAITLSSIKPRLEKAYTLTSKITMRNAD